MPTIPCQRWVCGCDPDAPIENLSAEAPDDLVFLSNDPTPPVVPPLGGNYKAQGCLFWCHSSESQEAADHCASQQDVLCLPDDPDDPGDPDDEDDGTGGDGGTSYFSSAAVSCTVDCESGNSYTHTLPYGWYVSVVSQADADYHAALECEKQAELQKFCFADANEGSVCAGEYFEHTFAVQGGTAPVTFGIDAMEIPVGMMLFNGVLSGYPPTSGVYAMTVIATDASVPAKTISKVFTLYVAEITTASPMPTGTLGAAYSETLAETGAPPAHLWNVTSGALPTGLTLNPLLGVISGTPTVVGTFVFTVELGTP